MRECGSCSHSFATAAAAAVAGMESFGGVASEMVTFVADERAAFALRIVEEPVPRPIAAMERAIIVVIEAVIGDRRRSTGQRWGPYAQADKSAKRTGMIARFMMLILGSIRSTLSGA